MATFDVKGEKEVVAALIEAIVVDLSRLVKKDLLASGLNWREHLFTPCSEVIHVQLLLLDKEKGGADADTCVSLPFELEYIHSLVIASGKVVEGWVSCHYPVSVRVFASRVDR